MKTYEDNGFRYFWDYHIKMWTIYPIDKDGNQISKGAEHYGYKEQLKRNYPQLIFKPVNSNTNLF